MQSVIVDEGGKCTSAYDSLSDWRISAPLSWIDDGNDGEV